MFTDEHIIAPSPEPGGNVIGMESKPKSPSPTVAAMIQMMIMKISPANK